MNKPSKKPNTNSISILLTRPEILKIIVDALGNTITTYTKSKIHVGKPFLSTNLESTNIAVGGFIRMQGEPWTLELFLGFSKELFELLYKNMFNDTPAEINDQNHDLAGEILNIAFGAMDPDLRKYNITLKSSLPKIFSGSSLKEILPTINSNSIAVPLMVENKSFRLDIFESDSIEQKWTFL